MKISVNIFDSICYVFKFTLVVLVWVWVKFNITNPEPATYVVVSSDALDNVLRSYVVDVTLKVLAGVTLGVSALTWWIGRHGVSVGLLFLVLWAPLVLLAVIVVEHAALEVDLGNRIPGRGAWSGEAIYT